MLRLRGTAVALLVHPEKRKTTWTKGPANRKPATQSHRIQKGHRIPGSSTIWRLRDPSQSSCNAPATEIAVESLNLDKLWLLPYTVAAAMDTVSAEVDLDQDLRLGRLEKFNFQPGQEYPSRTNIGVPVLQE